MNKRNPKSYTDELLEAARRFDGSDNAFAEELKQNFNKWLNSLDEYKNTRLTYPERSILPDNIIWVDASDDKLPATSESRNVCGEGSVVNTEKELLARLSAKPGSSLVISQCVNRNCYNLKTVERIEKQGSVSSPGQWTAPGGIFSNKLKTYRMLADNGGEGLIAKYRFIDPEGKTPSDVASAILDAACADIESDMFFVKPTTGGGGLGGFRLTLKRNGGKTCFSLPDMSRLSGIVEETRIEPLTVDPDSKEAIEELWWIYNKFKSSKVLNKNYIETELKSPQELKDLLGKSPKPELMDREQAVKKLAGAIELFEKKFSRRYAPLVNRYINFGTWGLRAHYRLSRAGIIVETIYARLFQIKFTDEGIGYAGADNISNKQTGELELDRLLPVNPLMVSAAGGGRKFFGLLKKGAEAFKIFIGTFPDELAGKIPARVQFDIAPVDGFICEGNADSARGFCLAQNFDSFTSNIKSWFQDSLDYYSFLKTGGSK